MGGDWYCRVGQHEFGPLTLDQLRQCLATGQLVGASPVRCGHGPWLLASQVPQLMGKDGSSNQPLLVAAATPLSVADRPSGNGKLAVDPRAYQRARQKRNLLIVGGMCVAIVAVGGAFAAIQVQRNRARQISHATSTAPTRRDERTPQRILNSVTYWSDLTRGRRVVTVGYTVELDAVWREESGDQRLLCVELLVGAGREPNVRFDGWKGNAVLADDDNRCFPCTSSGADSRVSLTAGQFTRTTLKFAVPTSMDTSFRLALSPLAFSRPAVSSEQAFGFRIAPGFILDSRPEERAKVVAEQQPRRATRSPDGALQSDSKATSDRPPSVQEINKQVARFAKEDADEQEKARQARADQIRKDAQMESDAKPAAPAPKESENSP